MRFRSSSAAAATGCDSCGGGSSSGGFFSGLFGGRLHGWQQQLGCCGAASPSVITEQVPVTTYVNETCRTRVPYTVNKKVAYTVVQKVPYTVTRNVQETITKKVPYTVTRMVMSVRFGKCPTRSPATSRVLM